MGKKTKKTFKQKNTSLTQDNKIMFIDKLISWGILLSLLLIPIVIKANIIEYTSPSFTDIPDISTGEKIELFSYSKYKILVSVTIILSLLFMIKVFVYNYRIKYNSHNIIVALFMTIILFSSVFATHKYLALKGIFDRNEGTLTFLCYAILFFITSNTNMPKNYLKWTIYILIPFTIINSIIGILNFYGINVLKQKVVALIIQGKLQGELSFSDKSILMGTLDQGNYLSGVSSMLFIAFFILAILCKNLKLKIINIILLFMSFGILLASLSNSGFITISLLVPLFLLILIIEKKYKKLLLGISLILSLSLIFIPMNLKNEKVWNETFGNYPGLTSFAAKGESSKPGSLQHKDNEKVISSKTQSDNFIPKLPNAGVAWGSGRGYIWKTTLPLIAKRPILGYGLDTLAYHFPQNDKNMVSGMGGIPLITKPHSLYLDIAFGTGVLGLIIFLYMVFIPMQKCFRRIVLNRNVSENKELIAISFILLAYLIQGIVNDSIIGISVVFYILLGILTSEITSKEEKVVKHES